MNKFMKNKNQKGQALISLMFFIIIALFLISAAVVMMISNSQSVQKVEGEEVAARIAEAGAEVGLIKLLRDPAYTGESITLPDGEADISVSGETVRVTATSGDFVKKLVVTTSFVNNVLSVVSWEEEY